MCSLTFWTLMIGMDMVAVGRRNHLLGCRAPARVVRR